MDSVVAVPSAPWSRTMTNSLLPSGTAYENPETAHLVIDVPGMTHDIEALHAIWVLEGSAKFRCAKRTGRR